MDLPSTVVSVINDAFVRFELGQLEENDPLYEVIHVATCRYDGNRDLARALVIYDIECNYEAYGHYESGYSFKRYDCCASRDKTRSLWKVISNAFSGMTHSDYVKLSF